MRKLFVLAFVLLMLPARATAQQAVDIQWPLDYNNSVPMNPYFHDNYYSITDSTPNIHTCQGLLSNPNGEITILDVDNIGAAQSGYLELFDEPAGLGTCNPADLIYGDGSTIILAKDYRRGMYHTLSNGELYAKFVGTITGRILIDYK